MSDPAGFGALLDAVGGEPLGRADLARIVVRLVAAGLLGAFVAHRPWRVLTRRARRRPRPETAQAQTMVALAGALLVVVIGDSIARAFGLVGLGAFIRFRSGIKDQRDASAMFALIAVGMACGLGAISLAAIGAALVAAALAIFDAVGGERARRVRVSLAVDGATPLAAVRDAFPGARAIEAPAAGEKGKIVLELEPAVEPADAGTILRRVAELGVPGVRSVTVDEGRGG